MYLKRNHLPWILLFCLIWGGSLRAQNSLKTLIDVMAADSSLASVHWGFKAIYTDDGTTLAQYNHRQLFVPASVMKLITTAASFDVLGPGYRYETDFQLHGHLTRRGTLEGDLHITGRGDPSLFSSLFKETRPIDFMSLLLDSLKAHHIQAVEGDVRIAGETEQKNTIPGDWNVGDLAYYYAAIPSKTTCFDNRQTLILDTDKSGNVFLSKIEHEADPVSWVMDVVSNPSVTENQIEINIVDCVHQRIISGKLRPGTTGYQVRTNIYQPGAVLTAFIQKSLSDSGIVFESPRKAGDKSPEENFSLLIPVFSPPLWRMDSLLNTTSNNLYAEHVYNTTTEALRQGIWRGEVVNSLKEYYQKKGFTGYEFFIQDGSGMSRSNALSPDFVTAVLKEMTTRADFQDFYAGLPVTGRTGTLKEIGKKTPAEGNIRAKSGSMNRVRNYAGYGFTKSGRMVAFCIMFNQFSQSNTEIIKKAEAIFSAIAQLD